MIGPKKNGFWSRAKGQNIGTDYADLRVGGRYRVIKGFYDNDGSFHREGEEWVYLGHSFVPYVDGLSLYVSLDGRQEWSLPLQLSENGQADVVENMASYITQAE